MCFFPQLIWFGGLLISSYAFKECPFFLNTYISVVKILENEQEETKGIVLGQLSA